MMNKKGFTGKDYMLAMLVFSFVVAVFVIMVASLANDYDKNEMLDSEFDAKFNKFQNVTDKADGMLKSFTTGRGLRFVEASQLFLTGGFVVIDLMLSSLSIATSQILSFGSYFGIPTEISVLLGTFIIVALGISLVFIIINSVRGGKEL
jgi:hypothetical protein